MAEELKEKKEQEAAEKEAAAAENEAAEAETENASGAEAPEEAAGEAEDAGAQAGDEVPEEDGKKAPEKKDKKDEKIEELTDRYRRLFAEFDNYRKRTDAEKASMFAAGEEAVLRKVLPLIDNFERALGAVPDDVKGTPYAEGVEKMYQSFMSMMKELGVEPIEAKGAQFDANLHNAVMHEENEELGESVITDEFQKGYLFKGKVLRYSMVKVAN